MFCGNCGTENDKGVRFCKNCGKELNTPVAENENSFVKNAEEAIKKVDMEKVTGKIKAIPKKVIAITAITIVALIAVVGISKSIGKTINLNDYLLFETSGYNGYGSVDVSVDWEAIEAKYGDKITYKDQNTEEYGGLMSLASPLDIMKTFVRVNVEGNDNLSNGTEITYTWSVSPEVLEKFSCKLKYEDGAYTIEGLTEVGTFDAFADVEMEFIGIAPNGQANINYLGEEMSYYDFDCDKTEGLRNGDIVTVTIDEDKIESYAKAWGKVPAEMKKEYTVDGLSSYVSKLDQIPADVLATMDQQAIDTYKAYIANDWADSSSLESFNYCGEYLLTAKSMDGWGRDQNYLYLVYKAQARNVYSNNDENFDQVTDVYWYICYDNLMTNPDGSIEIDITDYRIPGESFRVDSGISSGWWSTMAWTYVGYPSLDELYKDIVTVNLEGYNHEDHVQDIVTAQPPADEAVAGDA